MKHRWHGAGMALVKAAVIFTVAAVFSVQSSAQAGRAAAAGGLGGVGRALQDIGAEMARDADERERLEILRRRQAAEDQARAANALRLQQLEQERAAREGEAIKRHQSLIKSLSPVSGTAFAVGPSLVITNYHVVAGYSNVTLVTAAGKEVRAVPAIIDVQNDIAVLLAEGLKAQPLPVAEDVHIKKGARVYAFGFPRPEMQGDELKITEGIINSLTGFQGEPNRVQMSAEVQPGNSGGPILSASGAVLGIVVSGLRVGQNVNYAIKPSRLMHALAACECGIEKALKKPSNPRHLPSPEELAALAERSVFRVLAKPAAVSAARLERNDFSSLSEDERRQSAGAIQRYHPQFVKTLKSDGFVGWLKTQPPSVVADFEDAEFPEVAIRVLDRFYGADKAFVVLSAR